MLIDNHHRSISYLRLSVTDRCNLRCSYCMPATIRFRNRKELLSDEEIIRLAAVLAPEGINKVRITGGEPFSRRGLPLLLERLLKIKGIETLSLTSNGILALPYLETLAGLGIRDINLSMDTLQKKRFREITGSDTFHLVWKAFEKCLHLKMRLRINTVVMAGINTDELRDFALLTALYPVDVRLIEEMPFNGKSDPGRHSSWDHRRILAELSSCAELEERPRLPGATATNYKVKGHVGSIGIIPAYSRTFCGTCNRLRITSTGAIKTCLYGDDVLNVRDLMRSGASDSALLERINAALGNRHLNGWEAAGNRQNALLENMSAIGG
ncbi:cyclic pyranopterin monophosphate synthase subunit MoaA [Anseongella ginsenosidimutans]|uniref:GTP 3',8-cyclase n=1 Tax=Anseongella ginsenosidimutans TaxID=496056 RepID=A0A4R3L182_9SPHI|nr:GTP 3',8-cyclase MoaA [Anseongella ginsenosidimutans]QEC51167.1 GTP 3',8-cyclase MoaA [Anseongella ginsenosidimutans]TCS90162.1 cyclic pyranopterin monophosphate synthase subunit MoaA [Anseongella ginsenosidimutans]